MAHEAETPDNSTDLGELRIVPDEPTERDVRMFCVRAAIDLNRPGESSARAVLLEAKEILDFLNGSTR